MRYKLLREIISFIILTVLFASCSQRNNEPKEEQIRLDSASLVTLSDSTLNSIQGNLSLKQIGSYPNDVILTGLRDHRLVTVYKTKKPSRKSSDYSSSYGYS
jgi:hypothetical protein